MTTVRYHPGGFRAADPQQNRAEQWDDTTYTQWATDGTIVTTRPLNPQEAADTATAIARTTASVNHETLSARATAALSANTTYLALVAPTNAQVASQVRLLTQECSALIRLVLQQLDATS